MRRERVCAPIGSTLEVRVAIVAPLPAINWRRSIAGDRHDLGPHCWQPLSLMMFFHRSMVASLDVSHSNAGVDPGYPYDGFAADPLQRGYNREIAELGPYRTREGVSGKGRGTR